MKTPDYYLPIMPYLIVNNAAAFITFVKNVFDATEKNVVKDDDGTAVRHAELAIGDAVVMVADATPDYKPFPCSMFIMVADVDALYRKAMEYLATSRQEPSNRDYGYSAGFEDPYGNVWWLMARDHEPS